jgi:NitT/TauT family transport system ATP-binding protein
LNPDLLLMDEPFASLDAATREALQVLIRQLIEQRDLTLVLVTHSIEEAAIMGQKILILGKIPNNVPVVIENPDFSQEGYQNMPAFKQVCEQLRGLLEAAL